MTLTKLTGILLISFVFIGLGCGTQKKITQVEKSTEKATLPKKAPVKPAPRLEAFDPFYQQFHGDSIFQMSRIRFPLKGYAMDTSETRAIWSKENWVLHKSLIQNLDTTVFKSEVELQNTYYREKIYIDGGGFSAERIFKRIQGKWFLVSYIDEDM